MSITSPLKGGSRPRVAPLPGSTGEWQGRPGLGVYVHIPFCRHRCHYCDFNTYEGLDDLHHPYVAALIAEIERWDELWAQEGRGAAAPQGPATSVFFGGGTPTLLAASELGAILQAISRAVGIAPYAEVTVEANPETADETKFDALLAAGFNRVSVGIQSLVPSVLTGLGRTHSPGVALDAVAAARRAGFSDINADLIYGSPWESAMDWVRSIDGVISAATDHLSAYALTIEEGTPLHTLIATGRIRDVDPDVQAERHSVASAMLADAGFIRYEVSNWARPGHASSHNVLYWSAGEYLGFGAGAHGHVGGLRFWRTRLPRDYIAAIARRSSTIAGHELLGLDDRAREALMLGLRLTSGIDRAEFTDRFGDGALREAGPAISELAREGLLKSSPIRIRIEDQATLVGDEVLRRLL